MAAQKSLFPMSRSEPVESSPQISGLIYVPDFLTSAEQTRVLEEVDSRPWRTDLKRRVQHYGYRYDYKARRVDVSMYLGSLPGFALEIGTRLVDARLFDKAPDQLIVNEYMPGQGITAHVDCEPCFGDKIAMVSLGWPYEMDFIERTTHETRSILLATGSVAAISGDARYKWQHRIIGRKHDRGVPRKRRVSLTYRTVVVDE